MKLAPEAQRRADQLFAEQADAIARRTDRMLAALMVVQWVSGLALAAWITPAAWEGATRRVHPHLYAAAILGTLITALPAALALLKPGEQTTRHVIAVGQMLWSALLIHLTGGRVETHFHVFGSLAFVAFYRDWRVLVPATLVVAADHFLRGVFWPESVYGVSSPEWWRFLEHAFWVLFIDFFLFIACVQARREMWVVSARQAQVEFLSAEHARAEQEVRKLNADLEARVAARTTDLARANDSLARSLREQKQLSDKLLLADRLAALGQMSAGIAHEINNPLAYVITNLGFIESALGDALSPGTAEAGELRSAIAESKDGAERVRRIVAGLKMFVRGEDELREPVDLQLVLESVLRMGSNEIRHRARLATSFGALPLVLGDAGRLGQLFLNLVINAVQSLNRPNGAGHELRVSAGTDARGWAFVRIEDTGDGIAPETLGRIFDPFFTTKPVGVGTGLGLSICHGIATSHGGTIEVESRVGQGTAFVVALPPLGEERQPASAA